MISIVFEGWMIPTLITIISIVLALLWPPEDSELNVILNIILLVIALFISLVAWVIFAILQ
jgi:hypothetical protein